MTPLVAAGRSWAALVPYANRHTSAFPIRSACGFPRVIDPATSADRSHARATSAASARATDGRVEASEARLGFVVGSPFAVTVKPSSVRSHKWFPSFASTARTSSSPSSVRTMRGAGFASSPRPSSPSARGVARPPRRCSSHQATPFPQAGCPCLTRTVTSTLPGDRAFPGDGDELSRRGVDRDPMGRQAAGDQLVPVRSVGHHDRQRPSGLSPAADGRLRLHRRRGLVQK